MGKRLSPFRGNKTDHHFKRMRTNVNKLTNWLPVKQVVIYFFLFLFPLSKHRWQHSLTSCCNPRTQERVIANEIVLEGHACKKIDGTFSGMEGETRKQGFDFQWPRRALVEDEWWGNEVDGQALLISIIVSAAAAANKTSGSWQCQRRQQLQQLHFSQANATLGFYSVFFLLDPLEPLSCLVIVIVVVVVVFVVVINIIIIIAEPLAFALHSMNL